MTTAYSNASRGVHDMGAVDGFGALDIADQDELFHEDWERLVLALSLAMGATGTWTLDESRMTRERLPEDFYLSAGYYRIWLLALERLLVKHKLVTIEELDAGRAASPGKSLKRTLMAADVKNALAAGSPVDRPATGEPAYAVGDLVRARLNTAASHTRLPRYVDGAVGEVTRVQGCHVFPDTHAIQRGEQPQWLYNVKFDGRKIERRKLPQLLDTQELTGEIDVSDISDTHEISGEYKDRSQLDTQNISGDILGDIPDGDIPDTHEITHDIPLDNPDTHEITEEPTVNAGFREGIGQDGGE